MGVAQFENTEAGAASCAGKPVHHFPEQWLERPNPESLKYSHMGWALFVAI